MAEKTSRNDSFPCFARQLLIPGWFLITLLFYGSIILCKNIKLKDNWSTT